jgi:hypothetical protein
VDEPIACHLDTESARAQLSEWQALVDGSGTTERPRPNELLVRLDRARVAEAVDLAQREKACCAFFDFSLEIDANAIVLHIAVPPEASSVLDLFAGSAA